LGETKSLPRKKYVQETQGEEGRPSDNKKRLGSGCLEDNIDQRRGSSGGVTGEKEKKRPSRPDHITARNGLT